MMRYAGCNCDNLTNYFDELCISVYIVQLFNPVLYPNRTHLIDYNRAIKVRPGLFKTVQRFVFLADEYALTNATFMGTSKKRDNLELYAPDSNKAS